MVAKERRRAGRPGMDAGGAKIASEEPPRGVRIDAERIDKKGSGQRPELRVEGVCEDREGSREHRDEVGGGKCAGCGWRGAGRVGSRSGEGDWLPRAFSGLAPHPSTVLRAAFSRFLSFAMAGIPPPSPDIVTLTSVRAVPLAFLPAVLPTPRAPRAHPALWLVLFKQHVLESQHQAGTFATGDLTQLLSAVQTTCKVSASPPSRPSRATP